MELVLSPDQRLFQASAQALIREEHVLDRLRRLQADEERWSRAWWSRAAGLGWAAPLVPESFGGGSVSGDGVRDLTLLAEELGAEVAPGPLLPVSVVLAGLMAEHGRGPDHTDTIESLVSGGSVAAWAVYEPGRPWEPTRPGLVADASGDGYVLNGVKDRVEAADQADVLLVTAMTGEGVAQFLIPIASPGVTVTPSWTLDLSRSFSEVQLEGVLVGPQALVGGIGAEATIERQMQIAVVMQCAEICGGLDRAFDMTLRWSFDRYTFGRPIASYQAIKHRLADLRTWVEACHATTQEAAAAVQAHAPDASQAVSIAKSYVGDRALTIVQECVQVHGGIGVTWEHDLHLYLRRIATNRSLYGTPEDHRRRLADLVEL